MTLLDTNQIKIKKGGWVPGAGGPARGHGPFGALGHPRLSTVFICLMRFMINSDVSLENQNYTLRINEEFK